MAEGKRKLTIFGVFKDIFRWYPGYYSKEENK